MLGDLAGDLGMADAAKGVDIARVRGVAGTIVVFTRVSDSAVKRETADELRLRVLSCCGCIREWTRGVRSAPASCTRGEHR